MSRFSELFKKFEKRETDLHTLQQEADFSRFILVRSLSAEHLRKLIKETNPTLDNTGSASRLYETLFDTRLTNDELISFIRREYPSVRNQRREQEVHLPSIVEDFGPVKCGIRNDNLNDTAKELVRDKSISSREQLEQKIDDLLSSTIKGYILWQYYNQVTNDLIEHIFNDHPNIIPTLRKIKYVDFLVKVGEKIVPFDLKITHISDSYYDLCQKGLIAAGSGTDDYLVGSALSESEVIKKEYKRLKKEKSLPNFGGMTKQEMIDVLVANEESHLVQSFLQNRERLVNKLSTDLKSLEWWNYKWQGERLFKNNNRFFVFLAYKNSFEDARPLKGDMQLIRTKVIEKLNSICNGDFNTIRYYYDKDKGLEGQYLVNSTSVLVTD